MRALKDSGISWLGQVPQDWTVERLKYHASFNPQTELPEFSDDDEVSFVPMDHLKSGFHNTSAAPYQKVKKGYVVFQNDDILMAKVTPCLENGNLAIAGGLNHSVGFGSTEINVIRCDSVANKYLFYLLQCPGYIEKATYNMFGVAGLKRLEPSFIPNSFFPLPKPEEQRRIAGYLDTKCAEIDALIAAKERTNALLKERRQSIIFEAVTKGLDPNAPTKDSGVAWIGMVPKEWRIAPLKHFATIQTGFTLGRQYAPEKCVEYSYLRVANVQGEFTDLSDVATIMMPPEEAEQYKLHSGELLMTEGGDRDKLGRGSVWRGEIADCLHQNHIFAVATNAELLVEYLNYLTTSDVGRQYFDFSAKKTTNLASTNSTTIMNFRIPIPPVNDQQRIVTYLNETCGSIDALIQKNTNIVVVLREYRQSLIYEAVTGKIEV